MKRWEYPAFEQKRRQTKERIFDCLSKSIYFIVHKKITASAEKEIKKDGLVELIQYKNATLHFDKLPDKYRDDAFVE